MLKYTIAMSIRLVCFVAAIFVWQLSPLWALIPIVGAVALPYVAVVLANTVVQPRLTPVERPGGLVPVSRSHADPDS